jgi:hypothetical protein
MLLHNLVWFSGASLAALFFAAHAVRAEQESDGIQVADVNCEQGNNSTESRTCESALLRWSLCERGFQSERLPDAEVYACFLRSQ